MDWKLAEAKNRLSELINRALSDGPQFIRRRNDTFVVMTERRYLELVGDLPSLKHLLLDGPNFDGVDVSRSTSSMRDVEL